VQYKLTLTANTIAGIVKTSVKGLNRASPAVSIIARPVNLCGHRFLGRAGFINICPPNSKCGGAIPLPLV
jgi:hypothetical protein